jgi:hypothetical protein
MDQAERDKDCSRRSVSEENLHDGFGLLCSYVNTIRTGGYRFRMWWRDDDGCRDTTELRRLLMARGNVPVALAIIPGLLDRDLVNLIDGIDRVSILQHGWMHINWSNTSSRPSEYPEFRVPSQAGIELRDGLELLRNRFRDRFHPVFVPPWHSCPSWLSDNPAKLGYLAISRDAPLFHLLSRGRYTEVNVEIDTSDWKKGGSFIGPVELAKRIVRAFEIRLKWNAVSAPIGLLTHHAVLSQSDCHSLSLFVSLLEALDVVEWMTVKNVITWGL